MDKIKLGKDLRTQINTMNAGLDSLQKKNRIT